jgi:hypothetical protein
MYTSESYNSEVRVEYGIKGFATAGLVTLIDGEGVLIECNYKRIFEGGGTKGKLVGKIHSQDSFHFFLT